MWRLLVLSDHVKAPSNHYLSGVRTALNYVKQTKFHSNKSPILINKTLSLVWRVDLSQQAMPQASQLKRSEIMGCQWTLHLTLWPIPVLYLVLSLLHLGDTYGASSQVFKKRYFYGNKRKTKINVWKTDSEPRGQPANIFWCQGWSIFCSLKCFWWCLSCSGKLFEWLTHIRHEDYLGMSYCGYYSEIYSKLFAFSLQDFGEKGNFRIRVFQVKTRRKNGNFSLESYSQIIEKTRRIENSVQFTGGKQNFKDN